MILWCPGQTFKPADERLERSTSENSIKWFVKIIEYKHKPTLHSKKKSNLSIPTPDLTE